MATIADIVQRIDDKIYALINDVNDVTSYRIGQKQVDKAGALKALTELRKQYEQLAMDEPYEDIRHVAMDYGEFGEDLTEFIGDAR